MLQESQDKLSQESQDKLPQDRLLEPRLIYRVLLALGLLYGLYRLKQTLDKLPPAERRRLQQKLIMGALIGLVLVLAVTGRLHWIGAVIALLIPAAKGLINLLNLYVNLRHKPEPQQQSAAAKGAPMSKAEALLTLGLNPGASREDIIAAHRRLIQKLHPDRGGNDYLAARINEARDLLLKS